MFYYRKKKYFIFLVNISLLFGQAKTNMPFFQSDKYVLGGFMNVDDDGLDFEFLANVESQFGLYSNIWLSQIDYYSNTDVQSNFSVGYNKKLNNDEILLANIDGEIFACDDICSHSYASLCEGDIDGAEVECPLHGAIFNVKTGEAITPPAVVALRVFEVHIDGDDILVGPAKN